MGAMRAVLTVFLLLTGTVGLSARLAEHTERNMRPAPAPAGASEPWEIALHGADGLALAGATVRVRLDGGEWREAATDGHGRVQVPAATGDGHVEIAAGDVSWEVEGSGATLHCSGFAPLTAVAVDGETGAPIPGLASQAASHLAAGPERVARFEVQAPDGYVEALRGPQEVTAHVSRWAREVRVVAPLRREADIRVRVVNAAGEPAPGATVAAVYLAGPEPQFIPSDELPEVVLVEDVPEEVVEGEGSGAIRHTSAPADDDGWIRVRGAPHLLDEHYWIVAGDEEHGGFAGITLGSFGERYEREIRLPEAPVSAWQDWGYSCRIGFG